MTSDHLRLYVSSIVYTPRGPPSPNAANKSISDKGSIQGSPSGGKKLQFKDDPIPNISIERSPPPAPSSKEIKKSSSTGNIGLNPALNPPKAKETPPIRKSRSQERGLAPSSSDK